MTKLLSLDLAYSGDTGWVVWDDELPYPVRDYGSFHPKGKTDYQKVLSLYQALSEMIYMWRNVGEVKVDYVTYEQTDWHRQLLTSTRRPVKDFEIEYKKERLNQWSLGMAHAVMTMAATTNIPEKLLIPIGAMEAKHEFGSATKKGVAELLANEYPNNLRFYNEREKDFLYDIVNKCDIEDHVSDAMAIASVVAKRIRQNELSKS